MSPKVADITAKAGPVVAIALTTLLAWSLDWLGQGMKLVGAVPQGFPPITAPVWDLALWRELFVPALLISVVGFVESVSVGQTLAAKRRRALNPTKNWLPWARAICPRPSPVASRSPGGLLVP